MTTESNKRLKIAIGILAVLLIGSVGYNIKQNSDLGKTQTELTQTTSDKENVIADLEALKATYDAAIAENTSLSDELKAERQKVVELLEEVKKQKATTASLSGYKKRYQELEAKMNSLILENEQLKADNEGLVKMVDSTNVVLFEEREYTQQLLGQNDELSKKVDIASKLTISDLKTGAYKVKNSGKEVATERARRADILKIEFTIAENKIAKTGDKNYYVQVIDGKNNVLGERQTVQFGEQSLTYSFISTIDYNNSKVKVSENLKGDDFEKGLYHVYVYDGNELVASQSFTLK
jgi:regulator of replication initiation timing